MSFPFRAGLTPSTFSSLVEHFRSISERVPDIRTGENTQYSMADASIGAFSVFFTQSPSFLDAQLLRLISFKGEGGTNSHAIPGHSIKLNLDVIGTNTIGVRESSWQTSAFWLRRVKEES
jgi:hypothetical protein